MATRPFCGIVHNASDGQLVHLPLEEVKAHIRIVDVSATVTLTQIFSNTLESETPRAKYVFPVPARAAVCAFEMRTEDGRVIAGVAKESQQASEEHRQAIQQGKLTALVEWATDDIFTISVGSLPSLQKVITKLTYVMDLMDDDFADQVRFQLPMSVGERYGALPAGMVDASSPSPSMRVRITANIQMKGQVNQVVSPTHPEVSVSPYQTHHGKPSRRRFVAKYRSSKFLQQDFVLSIQAQGLDEPRCFVERDAQTGSTAMQLTLIPKFDLPPVESQEYIFLVDRSGSMSGSRINTAKQTLVMLLHALPPRGTSFNIFSFGTTCDSIYPHGKNYDQNTLLEASRHADAMDADYGGTEIRSALEKVFTSRNRFVPTAVFLLTDGEAHDIDPTIAVVTNAVAQAPTDAPLRVFTLGIGRTTSSAMCEGIARAGNGVCLMSTTSEGILAKTAKLLRAGRTFIIRNISVDWGVPADVLTQSRIGASVRFSGHDDILRQAPHHIETIYPGSRFVVFALINYPKFHIPREVILRGQRDGEGAMIEIKVPIDTVKFTDVEPRIPFIHVLAARRIIRDLEDRHPANPALSGDQIKSSIVRLGVQYQLASRFTSFIAVDGANTRQTSDRRHSNAPTPTSPGTRRSTSPRTRRDISGSRSVLGSMKSLAQTSLDYTASFFTAFVVTWFGRPPSHLHSPPDSRAHRSFAAAGSGSDAESEPDGHLEDQSNTNRDGDQADAESIRTFTTLSSLEPSSESDWSDADDPPRGRQPTPPPVGNPSPRDPSPDLRQAISPSREDDVDANMFGGFRPRGRSAPVRQPQPSASSSTPPVKDSVLELVRLQSFDGSFVLNDQLGNIVGSNALELGKELGVVDSVWATALAVAYFRKHLTNQPELLQGLEEKAIEFVSHTVLAAGIHFTALVERAKSVII